jgi:hypothetical protein
MPFDSVTDRMSVRPFRKPLRYFSPADLFFLLKLFSKVLVTVSRYARRIT